MPYGECRAAEGRSEYMEGKGAEEGPVEGGGVIGEPSQAHRKEGAVGTEVGTKVCLHSSRTMCRTFVRVL